MNRHAAYITDGISQRDRYPASLDPGYFQIDERTTDDLLLFVTELSFKYNYYNEKNEVSGNWLDFFLTDPNLMLRLLPSFDFNHYDLDYNRNKQQLLHAVSKEELKKVLTKTIEQIYEFIYFQHGMFEKFKKSLIDPTSKRLLNHEKYIESSDVYTEARLDFYKFAIDYQNKLDLTFSNPQMIKSVLNKARENKEHAAYIQISPFDDDDKSSFFENLYGRTIDVFDNLFSKFQVIYNQLKITSTGLQKGKQEEKIYYQPHISLLLSFLELYQVLKKEMNLLTEKHLDFYFKKLLGIEALKAEADKVSVILSLNKGVNEYLLEAGESLLATIPGKAEKEIFRLKEDTLVTRAKIAELKTVYKTEYESNFTETKNIKNDYVIYAACNPGTEAEDYVKKNYKEQLWPLFGEDQQYLSKEQRSMQLADMGLLISSPVLFTVDGLRNFTITIHLTKSEPGDNTPDLADVLNPEIVGKAFIIDITGPVQWIRINEYRITCSVDDVVDKFIKIEFTLQPQDPATGIYRPAIHGSGMQFKNPVIRFMLNFNTLHNPYTFFQEQEIERVTINVAVQGSNRLQLQNNTGRVSPSNPFQLFGPLPSLGNYLDISNPDIFNRFTKNFDIILKWENLPGNLDGFTSYYTAYNNEISNESFKVKLSSGIEKDDRNSKKDQIVLDLFQMNDNEFSQYLSSTTTLSRTGFRKLRFDNELQLLELENPKPDFRIGTVRLELVAPADAFCHQLYPVIFPKVLMHNSKWYVFKPWPTPNPPYAPIVNSVLVNYELEHSEVISGRKGNDIKSLVELCHIYPFGHKKIYPQEMQEPAKLIPAIASQGNLFLGLADVIPGKSLTLLFQLDENNFESLEDDQPVQWHYLHRNKWEEIDRENILEDNTYDFKGTGTVKLIIPENITNGNTLFDPAYYWISISCNTENRSKVRGIFTQVATAIRDMDAWGGESLSLAPDRLKEFARQIPELKSINQPFYSYNGQLSETVSRYYSRVSENLRHKNRIINTTDISQKILENFPEIHKVLCFNNPVKKQSKLTSENIRVVVIPNVKINGEDDMVCEPKVNTYTLFKIKKHLTDIIPDIIKVNVYNPDYEKIKVICSVQFKKENKFGNNGIQIQKLNLAIRKFITPWQYTGDLDINTSKGIYPGEILNFIKDQPYIETVNGFNVIHFYKKYNPGTRTMDSRLIESYYLNKDAGNISFKPNLPPGDMKMIIKASRPGSILISSDQHLITVIDNAPAGQDVIKETRTINTRCGIGKLTIGEEFLVMNPYQVSEYAGITRSNTGVDKEDNFDFIF